MVPVANFLVTPTLLNVQFTDTSSNTPTSWSWDFGDSSSLDTTQNPSHTYSTAGTYTVKLTATNVDGSSILQRQIIVAPFPILPVTLRTFVTIKLGGLTTTEENKDAYIAQWQLYIQPLVSPEIPFSEVFNESAYPPLANALIASLAAHSILMDIAASSGASSTTSGAGGGAVKKIITGPAEVEFQDASNASKQFFGEFGAITQLTKEICQLAARLMILLPMCPPLPDVKILYVKAGRRYPPCPWPWPYTVKSVWNGYPYNIPLSI
jgi:PKD repeat protein